MISRLSNILLCSENVDSFIKNVDEQVKGRSKDKLENFYNNQNERFMEHISEYNTKSKNFREILANRFNNYEKSEQKTLFDEFMNTASKDEKLKDKINYTYVNTYLPI